MTRPFVSLALFFLGLGAFALPANGHVHVEVVYREGLLRLVYFDFDQGEAEPDLVRLPVGWSAARRVPALPGFTNLLGTAGTATWVLPQRETGDLLWLGLGNGTVRAADFAGPIQLRLAGVEGPGHFALYFDDSFGRPVPVMNTRDGVDAADVLVMPLGSHLHANWAFSAPGIYRVRLVAAGTARSGSASITSAPAEFVFEVVAPPPPVLEARSIAAGRPEIVLHAWAGLEYEVEASADLASWSPVARWVATDLPVARRLEDGVGSPARFYRARLRGP